MTTQDEKERESRMFWAASEGGVSHVTGYLCEKNPGYWWVPELGWSMNEGISLFQTEKEALRAEIKRLDDKIASLASFRSKLEARLS